MGSASHGERSDGTEGNHDSTGELHGSSLSGRCPPPFGGYGGLCGEPHMGDKRWKKVLHTHYP